MDDELRAHLRLKLDIPQEILIERHVANERSALLSDHMLYKQVCVYLEPELEDRRRFSCLSVEYLIAQL